MNLFRFRLSPPSKLMNIQTIAETIISALKSNHLIFICGNGGSASQSNHFAAELVNKFFHVRQPLGALSLASDISVITSIANDFSFDQIFSKQIEALGKPGDILVCLSTSGTSTNILAAAKKAKQLGIEVINFPTNSQLQLTTPETQELHLRWIHEISMKVEGAFVNAH